eukprot:TRINITY_DN3314_c0_g1_i1.p1 TRINITY_DN3314_c0_g1~~TRINITY_DN3314_c0_g1_i1.p1  ORF type:complete len:568 (+),score=111.20 TRINITY_DN3314_c0_g1_i1:63-1766(+)
MSLENGLQANWFGHIMIALGEPYDFIFSKYISIRYRKPEERLPLWYIILFSIHWLSNIAESFFIIGIVWPLQVLYMVGDTYKGTFLGLTSAIASLVTVPTGPIIGKLSDGCFTKWGRRKPVILLFTLLTCVFIIMFYPAAELAIFSRKRLQSSDEEDSTFFLFLIIYIFSLICYIVVSCLKKVSDSCCSTPYQAMMPDLINSDQIGTASGFFALNGLLGAAVGFGVFATILTLTNMLFALIADCVLLCITLCLVLSFEEPTITTQPPSQSLKQFFYDIIEPFKSNKNFRYVFLCRFLVQFGFAILTVCGLYYVNDGIKPPYNIFGFYETDSLTTAIIIQQGVTLVFAAVSALVGGAISDKIKSRKPVAISGCILFAISLILIPFISDFSYLLIICVFVGLGMGSFNSTEFALLADVIANEADSGKYMGVYHLSLNLPGILASSTAGFTLDFFQINNFGFHNFGYKIVFTIAGLVILLGGSMLLFVKIPKNVSKVLKNNEEEEDLKDEVVEEEDLEDYVKEDLDTDQETEMRQVVQQEDKNNVLNKDMDKYKNKKKIFYPKYLINLNG